MPRKIVKLLKRKNKNKTNLKEYVETVALFNSLAAGKFQNLWFSKVVVLSVSFVELHSDSKCIR